jgi:hypothetical protein
MYVSPFVDFTPRLWGKRRRIQESTAGTSPDLRIFSLQHLSDNEQRCLPITISQKSHANDPIFYDVRDLYTRLEGFEPFFGSSECVYVPGIEREMALGGGGGRRTAAILPACDSRRGGPADERQQRWNAACCRVGM